MIPKCHYVAPAVCSIARWYYLTFHWHAHVFQDRLLKSGLVQHAGRTSGLCLGVLIVDQKCALLRSMSDLILATGSRQL